MLQNFTPYQKLFGKASVYSYLRTFGCLCYSSTRDKSRKNFDARATKCIFLGFKTGVQGYKLMDLDIKHIFFSKDVIFYEDAFPLKDHDTDSSSLDCTISPIS